MPDRLLANCAGGDLNILFPDRGNDVTRCQISFGNFVGMQPDAHGVIARTEDLHAAGAGNARQHILHLQGRVIAQIDLVILIVGREKVHNHGEVWRLLGRCDAEIAHFLWQFGERL